MKHTHILVLEDVGIRVVLRCNLPVFDWDGWVDQCLHDPKAPMEMRELSIILKASGIGHRA